MRADYLSKNNTTCLKGLLALAVLMHHLYQKNSHIFHGGPVAFILQILGFLCVGVFFFLSGFGLEQSYKKQGKAYLATFLRKRVLPFYLIIVVLTVVYLLKDLLIGTQILTDEVVLSFVFGKTIINNGWYLQVQLLLYLLFWFAYRVGKGRVWVLLVVTGGYTVLAACLGMSESWYQSTMLFPLGVVWSRYEETFQKMLSAKIKSWLLLLVAVMVFGAVLIGYSVTASAEARVVLMLVAEIAIAFALMILISKVPINCGVTRFLGKYSMEIYAFQGLFMSGLRSDLLSIDNPLTYSVVVCLCTVGMAMVAQPLFHRIYALFAKKHTSKERL